MRVIASILVIGEIGYVENLFFGGFFFFYRLRGLAVVGALEGRVICVYGLLELCWFLVCFA